MSKPRQITDRLDQVGQELRNRPSIVDGVMTDIECGLITVRGHQSGFLRTMVGLAAAACTLIAVGTWLAQPASLYAQTVAALAKVKSVHVEGWTSQVVRSWPLEQPREQPDDKIPMDGWYWYDGEVPASHEQLGPVVRCRRGGRLQEYQQDVDLLFVADGASKDKIESFSGLERYLQLLQQEGVKSDDLGQRTEAGHDLHGVRINRGGVSTEYWFDVDSHLPFRMSQLRSSDEGERTAFELSFSYGEQVPESIVAYVPPNAKNLRHGFGHDGQQLAWNQHVQDVGLRLDEHPINGRVTILPRQKQQTYSYQFIKLTPDGKYWVLPLDHDQYSPLTVKNFINLRVQHGGPDRAPETWRVEGDLLDVTFPRADLIFEKDTPWGEWVQSALNQIGLEYADVTEERMFWVAKHDGRKLRPWQEVTPPVPYVIEGGKTKPGLVRPGIGFKQLPVTMHDLLADFNRIQNNHYTADHPIIIDRTELPEAPRWNREEYASWDEFKAAVNYDQYYVASDSPWFSGSESRQMARDWYEKEFGVTMTEEQRPMTIHVIRRKE
ncbi:MAG: hypothetical protein R3C53_25065 [Pirellulaceae bacterium]